MPSKIRLYFSTELKANLLSNLSNEQSHYIKNVMRLKPGDTISLFNSTNGEWRAKIVSHNKEKMVSHVINNTSDILKLGLKNKVIGIDEAKFFDDSLFFYDMGVGRL